MKTEIKPLTSLQVIRKHCLLDCKGAGEGSMKAVRNCLKLTCALYTRRLGHNEKAGQDKGRYASERERDATGKFEHKKPIKDGEKKQALASDKSQIIEVSESVIVSKKQWEKIQERLEEKHDNSNF